HSLPLPAPPLPPLSLHDALPICATQEASATRSTQSATAHASTLSTTADHPATTPTKELRLPVSKSGFSCLRDSMNRQPSACSSRSEEHTSELQSRFDLVCRLLLE